MRALTLENLESCPICGGELGPESLATTYTDLWDNREGHRFAYHPCARCRVHVLTNRPAPGPELAAFYARRGGCRLLDTAHPNRLVRASARRAQARKLEVLTRLAPLAPEMRVLEVGCGTGAFAGHLADTVGCEVHANDLDPALGERMPPAVAYRAGAFSAALFGELRFDRIVSHHVIEHVYDVKAYFEACFALLKPGGVMVLETPRTDCASFARYRADWGYLCAPRHVTLFSQAFFKERLAELVPFEDVDVVPDGYMRGYHAGAASWAHARHVPMTSDAGFALAGALYALAWPWAALSDRSPAVMTIAARKGA